MPNESHFGIVPAEVRPALAGRLVSGDRYRPLTPIGVNRYQGRCARLERRVGLIAELIVQTRDREYPAVVESDFVSCLALHTHQNG